MREIADETWPLHLPAVTTSERYEHTQLSRRDRIDSSASRVNRVCDN